MSGAERAITAVIMAGGRGERMGGGVEKPLVRIGGEEMVERVIKAARGSRFVTGVGVACSPNTPATARQAEELGADVLMTIGRGYVEDAREVVEASGSRHVLVVSSDLPFITSRLIDALAERYFETGGPVLSAVVSAAEMRALGFEVSYERDGLAPAGVSIFDATAVGSSAAELEEEEALVDATELVNVNTREDVARAETLLASNREKGILSK